MKSWSNFVESLSLKRHEASSEKSLGDKNMGIKSPVWFWATDHFRNKKNKITEAAGDDIDSQMAQLLAENPDISGATLLNLLKSKGYEVRKKEADTSGGMPSSVVSPGTKKESQKTTMRFRLLESAASDNGIGHTKFRVQLIQEGLGNLNDAAYYTREAIKSCVPVFEGKKMYADHPSKDEEENRPERSVRDVLGHFENVSFVEEEDGSRLEADLVMRPEESFRWARSLVRHAVEYAQKYPDKDFVGVSINAFGDARPLPINEFMETYKVPERAKAKLSSAVERGVDTIQVVDKIDEAISCDLVTEAGAGGRILKLIN